MRVRFRCFLAWMAGSALILFPGTAMTAQVYTDVTGLMGIDVPGLGSGAAWSDFDADGDMDLLVSKSGYPYYISLYRNDTSTFTNVTPSSGLDNEARSFAVGDFDNDGLDDVAFISFGYAPTLLFQNLGDMHFADVSNAAGIYGTYSWRCAWVDFDDDGLLDLYLCGTTSYLFRNLGDGTFEERASAAGMQTGGKSCAWLDYDNDGREDCYVGRSGDNLLYHNLGDGTFEEVAAAAGVNDPGSTSGVCSGDYDGDGLFDLYSVNINSPSNRLYRNMGDGTFQDATASAGVGDVGDGRTATMIDIDYDGYVDIFTSNHVYDNRLYRNCGPGLFMDVAPAMSLCDPPDPFGTGFADYDNDGDIDVFLATHFGNRLLRCDGVTNHRIQISLIGTESSRNAIGAVVRCTTSGRTTYLRVDGGHGMGDTDSRTLGFGLGASAGPFEIMVMWPSGAVETYDDLTADTHVVLIEDGGTGTHESDPQTSGGLSIIGVTPNPVTDFCTLRFSTAGRGPEPVLVTLVDMSGRQVWSGTVASAESITECSLPVRDLAAGAYSILVSTEHETEGIRIVLVR